MKPSILIIMLYLLSLFSINGQTPAETFPNIAVKTLSKEKLNFPADLRGELNILIVVFEQQAQLIVNTWADIILPEYEPRPNIDYYEIPMMSSIYKPIAWQVDSWMRPGIPQQYHDNTACFYGNRTPYFRALDMTDKSSCYLFVLDREGRILHRAEGERTPRKEAAFRAAMASIDE